MFELKRRPKALSYSSTSLFESDPDEFFLRYLAGNRATRLPQENFMAAGSAFDAYEKSALHEALFGKGADPKFEFDSIFCEQVEEHNRDWALVAGKHLFESYVYSGAHDDLLKLLLQSTTPPTFETTVERVVEGVPLSGKPDLRFTLQFTEELLRIVLDWKCKGYCSKSGTSPSKGYRLCRDGWDYLARGTNATKAAPQGKPTKSHNTAHNLYLPSLFRGFEISAAWMETCNAEYADQTMMYGWMLGEKPGDGAVVAMIDELLASPANPPLLRVANHRARVSPEHQMKLLARLQRCWEAIQTGHIFADMNREDSDARCEVLEQTSAGLKTDGSDAEEWFNQCTRTRSF